LWEYDTPHALEGWYKYTPQAGDSAIILIGFNNQGETGFVEKLIFYDKVDKWTKFTIPISKEYWGEVFDLIRILFVASAGVNWEHLDECKGQLGSTLWVDNISLNYTIDPENEIKQNLFSTFKANLFPNPVTDLLNIELNESFTGKVVIYNLQGSKIMEENVQGTQCQLNSSELAIGSYIYRLMKDNTIFAQGKFVVTR
jgi:hypothetical protein